MKSSRYFFTVFLALSWSPSLIAQADSSGVRGVFAPADSARPGIVMHKQDTAGTTEAFHMTKSATMAVGLSAVLPGAGQVYTKNYWKVPVIWGLGGYWIYEWFKQNDRYKEFRDLYATSVQRLPPVGNQQYASIRDFYRDQRDSFAWYLGFLYFLNLVDAYIDAHLYDFNVTPDLTLDGRVVPKVSATLRLGF